MAGEYRIDAALGSGAFGVVYRASHPLIGKAAAVKVLAREYSARADTVSRFLAEARAVNTIRHPNIVDIFSFGTLEDGRLYYVMELLDGETFAARIAARGRLEPATVVRLLRAVASALDAAHRKGIVHRDLKPENVFVAQSGAGTAGDAEVPKLLDFGVAKLTSASDLPRSHQTRTGAPIGTPHYMSPEQCLGLEVDHRSDIYALGVMCFEALTGRPPFDGESVLALMNQHTLAERPRASSIVPTLGAGIDDAIRRMMAVDPLGRPATAGQAIELLAEVAGLASLRAAATDAPRLSGSVPMVEEIGEAPTMRAPASQLTMLDAVTTKGTADLPARQSKRRLIAWLAAIGVVALGSAGLWLGLGGRPAEPSGERADATPEVHSAAKPTVSPAAGPTAGPSADPVVAGSAAATHAASPSAAPAVDATGRPVSRPSPSSAPRPSGRPTATSESAWDKI